MDQIAPTDNQGAQGWRWLSKQLNRASHGAAGILQLKLPRSFLASFPAFHGAAPQREGVHLLDGVVVVATAQSAVSGNDRHEAGFHGAHSYERRVHILNTQPLVHAEKHLPQFEDSRAS